MSVVDVMDDTFVPAPPAEVAARIADPAVWRACWPGLVLDVYEDRAAEGIRWRVSGSLTGTAEVWIEEYLTKGCIVHLYLRADPARPRRWRRAVRGRRLTNRHRVAWKQCIHALADELASTKADGSSSGREAGERD